MPEALEYITPELTKRLIKVCVDHEDKSIHKTLQEHCHYRYKDACEHYEEMAIHVYGTKPVSLLERVRPREDPAIKQYRLDSYEPVTKSTCKRALNVIGKIFNPKLYSIRFESDERAEILKRYSLEEYPVFNSIINYLSDFAKKRVIADANGVFLVQPYRLPDKSTERVQPFVSCYLSKDIHDIGEDFALLFDKYERLEKEQRWYYTFVNTVGIYNLLISKTTSQEPTISEVSRYEHNRGKLPLWFLGGEYSDKYDGLFESYFSGALPFWNEVIMDHSDLRGSIRMHMFPQKWEVADECEYVEDNKYPCNGGYIFNQDKGRKYKCPQCDGAGRKSVKGPYETYWVNRDRFTNPDGTGAVIQAPFGYVEPGTEGTKLLKEERDAGLMKGLSALNMDVLENIGTNQSGISKDIDRRTELQEFLQKIADQFFCVHLPNIFDWFAWYMFQVEYGNSEERIRKIQPEISKPTQFDVYSTAELTEQLKGAKEAKINPSYLAVKQSEVQNKEFQTNPELLKTLNLELDLDPLAEVSREDLSMMLMNGTVTKHSAIIHDNIRMFVKRALEENQNFRDKKYSEQMEILKGYADEIIEENKIHLDTTLLEEEEEDLSPGK